jgi:hypothetical protein
VNSQPPRLFPRLAIILLGALALAGCELTAASEREQVANVQTILAGTPSATPSPTITPTFTVTPTATPTVGPSPTASPTPLPTATPLPPTPTPNPALGDFSFCNKQIGSGLGRFSAGLSAVETSGFPAFEQLSLTFDLAPGSAPLSAGASCLSAGDLLAAGIEDAPDNYVLRIDLPGWLRDDRFTTAGLTETLAISGTRTITGAAWAIPPGATSGASLLIGLTEPLPYRLSIERNPTRLVIAVARQSPIVGSSDTLRIPTGGGNPELSAPLFYLLDGDLWKLEGSRAPVNLTNSPETETHFAVSPDGEQIAFCRAAAGLDPAESSLPVPSALWVMNGEGGNPRPLPQAGLNCADPAFNQDGSRIAFTVDETGALPTQRTIFTVPASGGTPTRLISGADEWSRTAPQWLADDALVFSATAQDGRSTLFVRLPSGEVRDVGGDLAVDANGVRYSSFGAPRVSPDGRRIAVSAQRADLLGADLLILAADGSELDVIGAQREVPPPPTPTPTRTVTPTRTPTRTATPAAAVTGTPTATATADADAEAAEATPTPTATAAGEPESEAEPVVLREGPYITRALGWDAAGDLIYLSALCASDIVLDYQVYRWAGGTSALVATGQSLGEIGAATGNGSGIAYVNGVAAPGPRGAGAVDLRSAATIWFWDLESGARGEIAALERAPGGLSR